MSVLWSCWSPWYVWKWDLESLWFFDLSKLVWMLVSIFLLETAVISLKSLNGGLQPLNLYSPSLSILTGASSSPFVTNIYLSIIYPTLVLLCLPLCRHFNFFLINSNSLSPYREKQTEKEEELESLGAEYSVGKLFISRWFRSLISEHYTVKTWRKLRKHSQNWRKSQYFRIINLKA